MGARLLIGARWFGPRTRPAFVSYAMPPSILRPLPHEHDQTYHYRWLNYLVRRSLGLGDRPAVITNIDGS